MKKLALLLVCLLAFGCALGEEVVELPLEQGTSPEFVQWLLEIAREEVGYVEGADNYSKYGEWAGDKHAAWCAEFVCWCVDQVDQRYGTELLKNVYPFYTGQNTGKNWFIKRGRFVNRKGPIEDWGYQWLKGDDHYLVKNEFIPHAGDLVFFTVGADGDTSHVALVEYVTRDSEGVLRLHVIEGNNPDRVQQVSYRLDDGHILGYGLCEDRVDTVIRSGNVGDKVEALQRLLCDLGYLPEDCIDGVCGSITVQAIAQFQREQMTDKSANGIADRLTQQAMEKLLRDTINALPESWLVQ